MQQRANDASFPWLRLLACSLLLWLSAGSARGEALQVLLLGRPDAELAARVRGQTRDLPLVLQVAEAGARPDRAAAEHESGRSSRSPRGSP